MISLSRITSDHIPYVVLIGTSIPKAKLFRFQNYLVEQPGFRTLRVELLVGLKTGRENPVLSGSRSGIIPDRFRMCGIKTEIDENRIQKTGYGIKTVLPFSDRFTGIPF
jgi:hypothetical protein